LDPHGRPIDYIGSIRKLPAGVWLGFYRKGIERLAEHDPYAAYNVSMHGEGLLTQGKGLLPYMPDYTGDAGVQEYLKQQAAFRGDLLERMRAADEWKEFSSEEHLWTNFKYMEVFDQLAQYVCNRYPFNNPERANGPTHELSRTPVPVAPGAADTILTVDVYDESNAIVSPYPFDIDPLTVSFPARLIPYRAYSSNDEFRDAFVAGERLTVTYTLHGGGRTSTRPTSFANAKPSTRA
jgi:hypothetical protein